MGGRTEVIKCAVSSRLLIIFLQYVANVLVPDHDANVFTVIQDEEEYGELDKFIFHILGGFLRWDSHHFMHIAKYGYTYEQSCAFLPLFPYVMYLTSKLFPYLHQDTSLLLGGIILNAIVFVFSCLCLHKLTILVLGKKFAMKAVVAFCFNPASVFFCAHYTESMFSFLSFMVMIKCMEIQENYFDVLQRVIRAAIWINLSLLTRSNGILNCGFLAYFLLDTYARYLSEYRVKPFLIISRCALLLLVSAFACILPFIFFQYYCYKHFCSNFPINVPSAVISQASTHNYILPGSFSIHNQTWCYHKIPLAYSYIQEHYWNVGFLKYYEVKQIPNFLLALPIVFIVSHCTFLFFKHHPKHLWCIFNYSQNLPKEKKKVTFERTYSPKMFVFVVHAMFLTIFNVLCINVQVTIRIMCSASPVLYWYFAYFFENVEFKFSRWFLLFDSLSYSQRFFLWLAFTYFISGITVFCNFLPYT